MAIKIPKPSTVLAKEGKQRGTFGHWEDLGKIDTEFGKKHFVRLHIASDEKVDGETPIIKARFNLSNYPTSDLYKTRKRFLGKEPSEELEEKELYGMRAVFVVKHITPSEGEPYAVIDDVNDMYPVDEPEAHTTTEDDDLPF